MVRRRLSHQQSQELVSRNQFKEYITKYGWIAYDEDPDLGEDFLIKIFRDGIPSGISFQVQLKSTKNINKLLTKDGNIHYRLDVDDLEHWDVEWPPVTLVIWDISSGKGWYIHIDEIIKYLDDHRPKWRGQGTTTAYIPFTNTLDKKGLQEIDTYLTQKIGPIILSDKEHTINVEFSFPKDDVGAKKYQELLQFRKYGDPVVVDGKYISKWEIPDAWGRVYGTQEKKPLLVQISPSEPKKLFAAQIEFSAPGVGLERLDFVEFYMIKGGQEQYTLSNEKQNIPYNIELIINKNSSQIKFSLTINYSTIDAIEAYKAFQIQKILETKGTITISVLEEDFEIKMHFDGLPWPEPPKGFPEFIEYIYQIQTKTYKKLRLRKDILFTYDDYKNAREMASIVENGTYKSSGLIAKIAVDRASVILLRDERQTSKRVKLKMVAENSYTEILGNCIELGPTEQFINGYWDITDEEIDDWISVAEEGDLFEIKLTDVELLKEFPNWKK